MASTAVFRTYKAQCAKTLCLCALFFCSKSSTSSDDFYPLIYETTPQPRFSTGQVDYSAAYIPITGLFYRHTHIPQTKEHKLEGAEPAHDDVDSSIDARIILITLSFVLGILNLYLTVSDKRRATHKSIYDEYWYREAFLKPIQSSLTEFYEKWSSGVETPEEAEELLRDSRRIEFLCRLNLQDLSPSGCAKAINYIEELEQFQNGDPDGDGEKAMLSLRQLCVRIHALLIDNDFNPDKVSKIVL